MILVDTSVWVDHLRSRDPALTTLLNEGEVSVHPFVVGELALGHLNPRDHIIEMLEQLPQAAVATQSEVLALIQTADLIAKGVGFVDVHLLASTKLSDGAKLFTRDKRLRVAADNLGIAHQVAVH